MFRLNFSGERKWASDLKWVEVRIQTTQEAVEAISHILHEEGASGVVIEDPAELYKAHEDYFGELYALDPNDYPETGVRVKAYYAESEDLIATLENLHVSVDALRAIQIDIGEGTITTHIVDEEDWAHAWKKYYHPVRVSERITIVPSWETYEKKRENEEVIELDPGMAFGTGTHPTTFMCLEGIEEYMQSGDTVIDVGTGTGILAIAAAKLGAKEVFAYDLDEVAVKSATENVVHNQVKDCVHVVQGNLLLDYQKDAPNLIVGNLLAEIVMKLSPQAKTVCPAGGLLLVSGIIAEKKEMVCDQLDVDGFDILKIYEMNDWIAICARKRG